MLIYINPTKFNFSLSLEDSNLQCEVSSAPSEMSRSIFCFEGTSNDGRPNAIHHDSMSKLCDDIANRIETRIKQQRHLLEHYRLEH